MNENNKHDLDECECGDYRRSHEDDTGLCRLCAWSPMNPFEPCVKFRLAKRFAPIHEAAKP